jgi:hypothetical protein
MNARNCAVLGLCFAITPSLLADFTYQETTKITGGAVVSMMKMAAMFSKQAKKIGEPTTYTVYLKGNRMARVSQDNTEIIDLDAETITQINSVDHTYTVMTFEQMREQVEAARKEMEKKQAEQKGKQATSSEPPPEMKFKVNVRETGVKKDVSGVNTSEAILAMQMEATDQKSGQTGAMAITNDMWMAQEIPGYDELREFQKRFALKMGSVMSGAISPSMLAMQPGMGQGLADLVKEMSKLKGVPVLQVMRIGTTANGEPLPAASEAPLPPTPDGPSGSDLAKEATTSTATSEAASHMGVMGATLGGFGGFGHKKKPADPPPADTSTAAAQPTSAVLIESNTEMGGFSSGSVDGGHFDVPSGFKQIPIKQHTAQ